MFNYNQFEKKLKMQEQVIGQKNEFIKYQTERKKVREKKAQQYKKRIENFIISMLENPQVLQHYTPFDHQFRDEHPELQIGDPQIYINTFKHENQRIKHLEDQQRVLQYEPIQQKAIEHTFRDRHQELEGPKMRFTCKTSIERIEELINQNMQTQVENEDFRSKKKKKAAYQLFSSKENMSAQEKREEMAMQLAKNLLPSLHNKTHFQATESLYNQLPLTLNNDNKAKSKSLQTKSQHPDVNVEQKDSSKELNKNSEKMPSIKSKSYNAKVVSISEEMQASRKAASDPEDEPESALKKKEKVNQLEAFNTFEASKKVLTTCNVIKQKNPKVNTLYKGTGHLICSPDKSIGEVYSEIIHKNKSPRLFS